MISRSALAATLSGLLALPLLLLCVGSANALIKPGPYLSRDGHVFFYRDTAATLYDAGLKEPWLEKQKALKKLGHEKPSRRVTTCQELAEVLGENVSPAAQMALPPAFGYCFMLSALGQAEAPKDLRFNRADTARDILDHLDAGALPWGLAKGERQKARPLSALKGYRKQSLTDQLSLADKSHYYAIDFVAAADFDGDGAEDVLAMVTEQSQKSLAPAHQALVLLTRTKEGGPIAVKPVRLLTPKHFLPQKTEPAEAGTPYAWVPNYGYGAIISAGFDIGLYSRAELARLHFSHAIETKLQHYATRREDDAREAVERKPITITRAQVKQIFYRDYDFKERSVATLYDNALASNALASNDLARYRTLPEDTRTAMMLLVYRWGMDFGRRGDSMYAERAWEALLAQDWDNAVVALIVWQHVSKGDEAKRLLKVAGLVARGAGLPLPPGAATALAIFDQGSQQKNQQKKK